MTEPFEISGPVKDQRGRRTDARCLLCPESRRFSRDFVLSNQIRRATSEIVVEIQRFEVDTFFDVQPGMEASPEATDFRTAPKFFASHFEAEFCDVLPAQMQFVVKKSERSGYGEEVVES